MVSAYDLHFQKAVFALTLASLCIFSNLYAIQPLLPLFSDQFNVTPGKAGLLLSSTVITMVIGLPVMGFCSDRMGRIPVMAIGLMGSFIPTLLLPFFDSFVSILILRALTGFFLAGIPTAAIAYIGEEIELSSRGLAVSLYIASNALGGMSGRVFMGYIADIQGWQAAFYWLSGFIAVMILLFFILLPPSSHFNANREKFGKDIKSMLIHLRNKQLLPIFGTGLLLQTYFTGLWTYLPFYLHASPFQLSLKWIALTYLTYGFGVIGSPIAGKLSQKHGMFPMMLAGTIFMASGLILTLIHSFTLMILGLSLICMGFFVVHSMAAALVSSLATSHKAGASSFYLVSYYVGVALGGTMGGWLWFYWRWPGVALLGFLTIPVILYLWKAMMTKKTNSNNMTK